MLSYKQYKNIIKAFCIYDILALLPMAIPFVNAEHIATLSKINELLGGQPWERFSTIELLFVQMLGILGTGWAVWRWKNFSIQLGRFEGVLRLLFSSAMFWTYTLTQHPLIGVFAVIDFIAGTLHLIKTQNEYKA